MFSRPGVIAGTLQLPRQSVEERRGRQRRIELEVYTDHAPAIRLYERFGFAIEDTARDFAFRGGAYVDAHDMARGRGAEVLAPQALGVVGKGGA